MIYSFRRLLSLLLLVLLAVSVGADTDMMFLDNCYFIMENRFLVLARLDENPYSGSDFEVELIPSRALIALAPAPPGSDEMAISGTLRLLGPESGFLEASAGDVHVLAIYIPNGFERMNLNNEEWQDKEIARHVFDGGLAAYFLVAELPDFGIDVFLATETLDVSSPYKEVQNIEVEKLASDYSRKQTDFMNYRDSITDYSEALSELEEMKFRSRVYQSESEHTFVYSVFSYGNPYGGPFFYEDEYCYSFLEGKLTGSRSFSANALSHFPELVFDYDDDGIPEVLFRNSLGRRYSEFQSASLGTYSLSIPNYDGE